MIRVAHQLLCYDEPDVTSTLDAWAAQSVPERFDVSHEVWVTPSDGRTLEAARRHQTFRAYEAPPGKLPSRNVAHDHATSRGYDALVVSDADAPPLGHDTLATLLSGLEEPGVAGVNARAKAEGTILALPYNAGNVMKTAVGGMNGQCHALTAEAWCHAGPFRDVNSGELRDVWREEEFVFPKRVREVGRVKTVNRARVLNDTRRAECRYGMRDDAYCERMDADVTFSPRNIFGDSEGR